MPLWLGLLLAGTAAVSIAWALALRRGERRLIALVSAGMNDDEIGAILHHDKGTVSRLIKSVSHRLGAKDRYELVLYGLSSVNDVP